MAGVLLVVGAGVLVTSMVLVFAWFAWPGGRSGYAGPLLRSAISGGVLLVVGTVLWGWDRWRAVLGTVSMGVGVVSASVAATVPFATRSIEWTARGGPAPDDLGAALFLVASAGLSLAGWNLRSRQPDPRSPLAVRLEQAGPAPIREAESGPRTTYGPEAR